MIGKLGTLMVVVKDMDRSVKFYCDVLGLKVKSRTPEWTALDAGNIEIGLHSKANISTFAPPNPQVLPFS